MPDKLPASQAKTEINPTRLENTEIPEPKMPVRMPDDPAFAAANLTSEEGAVREYMGKKKAPQPDLAPEPIDKRLSLWGYAALAMWFGALTGVAVYRGTRKKSV